MAKRKKSTFERLQCGSLNRQQRKELASRLSAAAPDLEVVAAWLKSCGVTTVAMQSTGVSWIAVSEVLAEGLDVYLVNARGR